MQELIIKEELMDHSGISSYDKNLIEEIVNEYRDGSEVDEENIRDKALRGFLVCLYEEMVPNAYFRATLRLKAAAWSDGWDYAEKFLIAQTFA